MEGSAIKDVLLFESDAFSLEPPLNERGLRYDLPLGDDIAALLKERLEEKQVDWEIPNVVQEDFGAVLMFCRRKKVFTVNFSWQGGNQWGLVFNQMNGCIGWLFSRPPEAAPLNQIKVLVDQIIQNDPQRFHNPRWIANGEFPGVVAAFVIPEKRKSKDGTER